MEVELKAEARDRRLARMVAITVVALSVFTGFGNIKDGNIVQAMQQAKADSVDRWGEYQATRTKAHIAETARTEISVLIALPASASAATAALRPLNAQIARYHQEIPRLRAQAAAFGDRYDALNVHDDQFDASEALISTAISMAAVSALVESSALLIAAWAFGAFGIVMGLCGFAGLAFHPDILSNLLG